MDWGYIATIVGLLTTVAGFLLGRKTAAKEDGKREGNMMSKLDAICDGMNKIDSRLSNLENQNGELRDRLTRLETKMEIYHGGDSNT